MIFWDSSALVPLVIDEPTTDKLNALFRSNRKLVVSFITPLEVESAVWRRVRPGKDDIPRMAALRRVDTLAEDWTVVTDIELTLAGARRMVKRYGLRTADAIQLSAALLVGKPADLPFVSLDEELLDAAHSEGFPTLP